MNTYKTLFEQQSYQDALYYYTDLLHGSKSCVSWDYVILTASNEAQAKAYREQIAFRQRLHMLPADTCYVVLPDPDGKRVGSGGATLNAIRYVYQDAGTFAGKRILVIHSGGDSKRVPQYSACGKLFSPVPRELPNGRRSTLFDEFMIGMSTVAPRLSGGMLVCSGDVLLLFNALQIDFYSKGAAALSIKEDVKTGKNHGVFLKGADGNVGKFLHKQTTESLTSNGAVDAHGKVNIDTGAVIFDSSMLSDLYSLVNTEDKFHQYVNEQAGLSFYADFLYPMASHSTLEQFYKEKPEGAYTPELHDCRTALWNTLNSYEMKLIQLSPASFIHFGTTKEMLKLVTEDIADYQFLGWSRSVCSNCCAADWAANNSYISRRAQIGNGSYIEDSYIHHASAVGEKCVISGATLNGENIPDQTVLHVLKQNDGRFVARLYSVNDNPKGNSLFGLDIGEPLWTAPIYPVCDTIEAAVKETLRVILHHQTTAYPKTSLKDSFNNADVTAILPWQEKLSDKIGAERVLQAIDDGVSVEKLNHVVLPERTKQHLLNKANSIDTEALAGFSHKIRIYYYLSKLMNSRETEDLCFNEIRSAVLRAAIAGACYHSDYRIAQNEVTVQLPVRVNWGGGWSDTPPYCMEHGGTVLNAAISFDGKLPIEVTVKKLKEPKIILASTDIGSYKEFTDIKELQDCRNPSDAFALHKAALIACGVIPYAEDISVKQICVALGGGLYLNTRVINIPKGSGLGTSSILAGACVKALYQFLSETVEHNDLYNRVLCMEQLMSTGGGWQDQVGGLTSGVKMVTSRPAMNQQIECTSVSIADETMKELSSRFCLIYTGQRRLARNLLREVVGKYIGNSPESLNILYKIQQIAVLMRFELEKGNIDGFSQLLNEHWTLSQQLDKGCTNTCIDQIFLAIDDLIDGKMICGAGGGGFLQVILKKGITKQQLRERLHEIFQDSGVDVWSCRFE